jgi:hypothetical protein
VSGAKRRVRGAALIAMLLLALPLLAAEPWVDAYNRGVAAVNASNYKLAASELQKAIATTPGESTALRTRSAIITYVPHFWLGIAKYNLGDVDGALREWHTSDEQGAIGRTEYYGTMKNWIARAQAEKKHLAQGAASGAKKAASDAISSAVLAQTDALSASAERTDSYRVAVRTLQDANAKYNSAGTDIDVYTDAAQMASKAASLFTAAADEARRQRAARPVPAKPQPKPQQPSEFVVPFPDTPTTTTERPNVVETPKSEPPKPKAETPPAPVITKADEDASAAVQQYRRNVSNASRATRGNVKLQTYVQRATGDAEKLRKRLAAAKGDAELQVITQIANELDQALARQIAESKSGGQAIPPVPVPAPVQPSAPELRDAYRAFASGSLASSEDLLTKILAAHPSPEAYLLRGCARYTRAMLSRTPDPLLNAATADFKAALQQNRALRLDSHAFSPKLIAYFEQIRNGSL